MNTEDRNIVFEIFYLINEIPNTTLLRNSKSESTPEYVSFVISLIHDKESATVAFEKLQKCYEDLEYAISLLVNESKTSAKQILPADEIMIIYLLEGINKLLKYKSLNFFRFLHNLQILLKLPVHRKIKGNIYDILSFYVNDKDLYIEKIVECRDAIESEIKKKDYFLLPRLIRFTNAYARREELEMRLFEQGKSLGSPYISSTELKRSQSDLFTGQGYNVKEQLGIVDFNFQDYKTLGLKSEDPQTVMECFDSKISPEILRLNATHIRNTMIKNLAVIEKIMDYQLEHKIAIEDIIVDWPV